MKVMNYKKYHINDVNAKIIEVVTNYKKSGNEWIKEDSETRNISNEYYNNSVDAIQFFNDELRLSHTKYGRRPVMMTCYSPDGTIKYVRRYYIEEN